MDSWPTLPQGDTREVPAEGIHQHLHQTLLPREIQLDFYPNTLPLRNSYLSSQDLFIKISLAQLKLVFHHEGQMELSVEAICSSEHASFLQSTRASGQASLDCFTEQWTLSRALCSVSLTRWPSKTGLGVSHPKPLALQSD